MNLPSQASTTLTQPAQGALTAPVN
jgi:hypothetical protein